VILVTDNANFFNQNAEFYSSFSLHDFEKHFLNFVQCTARGLGFSFLDIGGGNGFFAKTVLEANPMSTVTVIDPSKNLLNEITDKRIIKILGNIPYDFPSEDKYDYIHLKEVIHHITGNTIKETRELLKTSLSLIKGHLNPNGYLMIHDLFYDGYIYPPITRFLIFYFLILQNKLRVKIPIKEFLMDLNVCFYTRQELKSLLLESGFVIVDCNEEYWDTNFKTNLMLLHKWGRILITAQIKPL
jgi:SAM-dependent methyltransferase